MVKLVALSVGGYPRLPSVVPESVVDLYSGGCGTRALLHGKRGMSLLSPSLSRLDGEFPRFAGRRVFLVHLCPASAPVIDEAVDHRRSSRCRWRRPRGVSFNVGRCVPLYSVVLALMASSSAYPALFPDWARGKSRGSSGVVQGDVKHWRGELEFIFPQKEDATAHNHIQCVYVCNVNNM